MMAFIALFHLVFFLIKVALLSTFYSAIILAFAWFYKKRKSRRGEVASKELMGFYLSTFAIISFFLLCFSFTTWGNRGFYDTARLPVGHGVVINCSDGEFVYFTRHAEQQEIGSFALRDDKIFTVDADYTNYLIYDCRTSDLKQFASGTEYDKFAQQNNCPSTSEFREFFDHYNDYWSGWRFWLLP